MSVVTNLMLAAPHEHDYEHEGERRLTRGLAAVKAWCDTAHINEDGLESIDRVGWPEKAVDTVSAGTKHMEIAIYAWGLNYFAKLPEFLEVVRTAPWRTPAGVQVFVREQDDECFSVYTLTADRMWLRWPLPGDRR